MFKNHTFWFIAWRLIMILSCAEPTYQVDLKKSSEKSAHDQDFLEVESGQYLNDDGFKKHIWDTTSFHRPVADKDYVIIHPARVDNRGEFLSHQLNYFAETTDTHSRKKRSVNSKSKADTVYYSFEINGRPLLLNLSHNHKLLGPSYVVERIYKNAEKNTVIHNSPPSQRSLIQNGTNWECHLRGYVVGEPESSVAISSCQGLSGLIRLQGADYFIEPLNKSKKFDPDQPHLHKVYKHTSSNKDRLDRDKTLLRRKRTARSSDRSSKVKKRKNWLKSRYKLGNEIKDLTSSDFCGVIDTRELYRRALRRRRIWEARRRRKTSTSDSRRIRRSLSLEHWVEMLVVVDYAMVKHYEGKGEDELERYVLTIINMVSELFHDVSIGNSLHVTLIRLIILHDEEESLKVTSHAEKTLDNFCRWAKRMNPQSDQHANHHDVAVLLTRQNLCSKSNKSCETLGLAHVAGMCQPHRSCNVNQDTGLSLAFTVAHELGHNFAMHHDGQLNNCEPNDEYPRIMAPHLTSNHLPMKWSSCSRRYVTRFLDRNWGFCLLDTPSPDHDRFNYPKTLPGVIYSADHQCQLMFGFDSKHCKKIEGHICTRLWCYYKGTCRTRLHSAVAGTECGRGKWCSGGACVKVERTPASTDGSWGPWTSWSRCSRTCGVGISQSARYCDQPAPKHGGRYCLGERRRYKTCNVWNCPMDEKSVSFRTQQCAEFNKIPYRNHTYNWLPVDSQVYPCELHCYTRDGKHPFADRLRDKVVDGTKCFAQGKDICVNGICKHLGCDFKIDSIASEDKCGVCRGDGSTCSEINNNFTVPIGDEYVPAGLIPKGASKIVITEMAPSGNFLALRSAKNESEFYLNGNYMIQHDFQFDLAGTVFKYKRTNKTIDYITAEGPIMLDIIVMVLFVEENPGVNISYILPHNVTAVLDDSQPVFEWRTEPWTPCSSTCGKGFQTSPVVCVEKKSGVVDEDFCDEQKRPLDERKTCQNPECPAEWFSGPWNACSVTCGGGLGRQERRVLCVRSLGNQEQIAINSTECNDDLRLEEMRSCSAVNQQSCPVWKTDQWDECTKSCGKGLRQRHVSCVTYVIGDVVNDVITGTDGGLYRDERLDLDQNSISRVMIVERPLERNLLENFDYDVEEDKKCDEDLKPTDEEECNLDPCQDILLRTISNFSLPSSNEPLPPVNRLNEDSTTFNDDLDVWDKSSETKQDLNHTIHLIYDDPLDQIVPSPFINLDPASNVTNINDKTWNPLTTTATITTTSKPPETASPRWLMGVWGPCSTTCGIGARIRNVVCSAGSGNCDNETRPAPAQRCRLKPCAVWKYAGWTKCSRLCGLGKKRRKVFCRGSRSNQLFRPYHCNSLPKLPRIDATCNPKQCIPWRTSRWGRCNVSCGLGTQRRRVVCHRRGMCDLLKRPIAQKNCRLRKCYEWRTYHWGRCPVKCGIGVKRRVVRCQEKETGSLSLACNPRFKPNAVKKCNRGPCRVTDYDFSSCTGDRLKRRFCALIKAWGKCVQPSLAIQCCQTCKTYISVRRKDKIS